MKRTPRCRRGASQCSMHPVATLLADFLDVRSVWSIGHEPADAAALDANATFLVFADERTLARLRKSPALGAKLLVVTDGDLFQDVARLNAIGGSLARAAWQQTSAREAFYDEAHWADAGDVVRVRRKALLVWNR
jgi:hypothetical protein